MCMYLETVRFVDQTKPHFHLIPDADGPPASNMINSENRSAMLLFHSRLVECVHII